MPQGRTTKPQELRRSGTLNPAHASVRAALFVEHPTFFDARDELQVKYEMLRAQVVDGQGVTEVSRAFGYSRQTVYLVRDRFRARGLMGLRDHRPGPVGPSKCTPEVLAYLDQERAKEPTVSAAALVERLARARGVRLHRRTVERVLGRARRKKNAARR